MAKPMIFPCFADFAAGRKMLKPLGVVFVVFYFTFHVISGEHGVYALLKQQRKLDLLQAELQSTIDQRKALEHHTELLSAHSLDRDMLDEQARRVLGVAGKSEMVIMLPAEK